MNSTPQAAAGNGQPAPYTVRLSLFEGPLDLLLHLIEKQELDVTAISLARVADQFVAYLAELQEVRPDVIVDFLAVAARLLLIKSRWLLPRPEDEKDEDEEDPGEALARRLREYKRFKQASRFFKDMEEQERRSFVRVAPPPPLETRLDPDSFSLDELIAAMQQALAEEPELAPVDPIIARRKVTVQEKISLIQDLVSAGEPVSFGSLLADSRSRIEVIVSLWAVLELIKRGRLRANQSRLFGEIVLVENPDAPAEPEMEPPVDTDPKTTKPGKPQHGLRF